MLIQIFFFTHFVIFLLIAASILPMDMFKALKIVSIVSLSLNNEERFTACCSGEITISATAAKSADFFVS